MGCVYKPNRKPCSRPLMTFPWVGLVAIGWVGCGASYQAIYEGEVRFEHCYRLDAETGVPLPDRHSCWKEWSNHYTYGQTRDRLEYALRRQRELTAQIKNSDSATSTTPPPEHPGVDPIAAADPTTPFAAPPHVQDKSPSSATPDSARLLDMLTSEQQPTAQPCLLQCHARWQPCVKTCDPKTSPECALGCDASFRSCGQRCFDK